MWHDHCAVILIKRKIEARSRLAGWKLFLLSRFVMTKAVKRSFWISGWTVHLCVRVVTGNHSSSWNLRLIEGTKFSVITFHKSKEISRFQEAKCLSMHVYMYGRLSFIFMSIWWWYYSLPLQDHIESCSFATWNNALNGNVRKNDCVLQCSLNDH